MNLQWLYQAAFGALSIGAAYAINVHQRPEFDTAYDAHETATATGTLTLSGGENVEVPLMTTHVVTVDVPNWRRPIEIRELALRAAADGGGQPRLELFVDLSKLGGDIAGGAHDLNVLTQVELPLLRAGRLGARRSYINLDGKERQTVATGNLLFTEISQVESGPKPVYRALGRLEVQVETNHGIDLMTGRFDGQISWDPTGT
jgi:hypothetical protein